MDIKRSKKNELQQCSLGRKRLAHSLNINRLRLGAKFFASPADTCFDLFVFSFQFGNPPPRNAFLMRGVVRYQWRARRSGRVLKRAMQVTKGGLPGVVGGIPAGRSDGDCLISA